MMMMMGLDNLVRDLGYALRRLARAPGFTIAAVLSLALGIGANTAIYSVVDSVLYRDLVARAPSELVELYTGEPGGTPYSTFSHADLRDVAEAATVFQDVAARYPAMVSLANDDGTGQLLWGEVATANLFDLLGVPAALGRTFGVEEDDAGAPVTVLSHRLWRGRFGADPSVVGRTLRLNGRAVTVVGVMAPGFTGQFPAFQMDLWVPVSTAVALNMASPDVAERRGERDLFPVARLASGVSVSQAKAELKVIAQRLEESYPDTNEGRAMTLVPSEQIAFNPEVDQAVVPVAILLIVVVGLVLAIACANLAGLLLMRAEERRKEIATRLAMGAGRGRLMRQLLTESVVLALLGGTVGLALAWGLVRALTGFAPPTPFPVNLELHLDGAVLTFAFGISVVTGILFGLAPALRASRPDVLPALKDGAGATVGGHRRLTLRNALVVGQVTVSLLLLVGAGLFVRSLSATRKVDPGFDPDPLALATLNLEQHGYSADEAGAFLDLLVKRLEAVQEVRSVAVTSRVPVGVGVHTTGFHPEGQLLPSSGSLPRYDYARTDQRYFETLGVPIVQGRSFTDEDRVDADVAIVSQTAAHRFWPGEDPVGKRLRRGSDGPWHVVVGVARDTKVRTLGEAPRPYVYLPLREQGMTMATVVVAARGEPSTALRVLRDEIRRIDPAVTPFQTGTMNDQMAVLLYPVRLGAMLIGAFGAVALVLAMTGLYGVVSYGATRRTREMGIRMAMGARPLDIVGVVLREGLALMGVGLALGLVLAGLGSRVLGRFLFGVGTGDALTFVAIPVLLAGVALLASWLPARRAARLAPVNALRQP